MKANEQTKLNLFFLLFIFEALRNTRKGTILKLILEKQHIFIHFINFRNKKHWQRKKQFGITFLKKPKLHFIFIFENVRSKEYYEFECHK
jgi:hypothetical protein